MTKNEIEQIANEVSTYFSDMICLDPVVFAGAYKSLVEILIGFDERLLKELEDIEPGFKDKFDKITFI